MNHPRTASTAFSASRRLRSTCTIHRWLLLLGLTTIVGACGSGLDRSDAYGNFETTEIVVSSEAAGRVMSLDAEEGTLLASGQVVGHVDTVQLALQRDQLVANRGAMRSRIEGIVAQIAVLNEQKRVATVEKDRIVRLIENRAATSKQRDDIEGQIAILDRQVASTRTQTLTIRQEIEAVEAQIRQVQDRLSKSTIVNPIDGVVLVKFVEAHELTGVGKPLYKIADLQTMYLRAYVSGDQLPHIRLGEPVTVLVDEEGGGNRALEGDISWIASQAEFTPKLIQTKEERVDLVYAFKVRVANPDGLIKIGMPGEVRFSSGSKDED